MHEKQTIRVVHPLNFTVWIRYSTVNVNPSHISTFRRWLSRLIA